MPLPRQAPPLEQPVPESTWTSPRPDCPHPERWHSTDSDSTELEVSELAAALVRALQPDLVVETGTAWGQTAEAIGRALELNGQGRLITFETDPERVGHSRQRCDGLPVEVRQTSSVDGLTGLPGPVGFAWLDSTFQLRPFELQALRGQLTGGAIVGVHDCGGKFRRFTRRMLADARRYGFTAVTLPTPRGVTLLCSP